MRFMIFSVLVLLAACQTTGDFIGKGPITLTDYTTNKFNEKYLRNAGPDYFYVSSDGTWSGYTYCAVGTGNCNGQALIFQMIDKCKKESGKDCYLFAEGTEVVWQGPVTYGSFMPDGIPRHKRGTPFRVDKKAISALSDKAICFFASRQWTDDGLEKYKHYKIEAKSRGFDLTQCKDIAKN